MKKLLAILLTVCLSFAAMFVMASAVAYDLEVNDADAEIGETVTINVSFATNVNINYIAAELAFDDTALSLTAASWNEFATQKSFLLASKKGIFAFDTQQGAASFGENFLTLTFTVLPAAVNGEDYDVVVTIKNINTTGIAVYDTATISVHPEHSFGAWTAVDANTQQRVCDCGAVESSAHDFGSLVNANATEHTQTCKDCAYVLSSAHVYGNWTNKDATNHKKTCTCGSEVTAAHNGGTATCTAKAVCTDCGTSYGNLIDHKGGTATCVSAAICTECLQPYGNVNPTNHTGGTATCASPAICTLCKQAYGAKNPDNHAGGTELRNEKAATTAADGYTGDLCCKGCDKVLSQGQVIPKQTPPTSDNTVLTVICIALAGAVAITGAAVIYKKRKDF